LKHKATKNTDSSVLMPVNLVDTFD